MSNLPKISIVTPTFSQSDTLEQTIDSVLSQGYPELEYIIIDGGSTDGTTAVLEKYARHLSYWVSEPDNGQAHALNKGFSRATGEILAYINSDDYYQPDTFSVVAQEWTRRKFDILYGKCEFVDLNGQHMHYHQGNLNSLFEVADLWRRWWNGCQIIQPEVFWSAEIYRQTQGFDERRYFGMDYRLWLDMFSRAPEVRRIDSVLTSFRVTPVQKTADRDAVARELLEILREFVKESGRKRFSDFERKYLTQNLDYAIDVLPVLNNADDKASMTRISELALLFLRKPAILLNRLFWNRVLL